MSNDRQKRWEAKQREQGLIRRSYWLPANQEAEVKRFIDSLTNNTEAK